MEQPKPNWKEYVEQTAKLMNLDHTGEYLPEVTNNFVAIANIASLVMEFELPEDTEIAPIFEP
ncbi:MAG: DUF4089 domain-containing protein [Xenococcaceae cyanobacterium MO_207.B15]|nr:DUF4089 domain-containing protein [Xenococcaceae cyanobacterium MO_207.B15]MDJ0746558.1 DUF4089 domain-containing protein [Xenococcaceae cyanobacterium MO_167.B27]